MSTKTTEITRGFMEGLVVIGRETMEQVAKDGENYMPKIVAQVNGDFMLATTTGDSEPFVELVFLCDRLLDEGNVTLLAWTADSYAWFAQEGDEIPPGMDVDEWANEMRHGQTNKALFEAGDPHVSEALTITAVDRTSVWGVSLRYVRNGKDLTWDPDYDIRSGDGHGGRMIEVMRATILRSASRYG